MKFLRLLLNCLVLVIALVALFAAVAFAPVVQTWIAQSVLARQPALQGTLGSFWAGFGKIDVAELQLKIDGADLKVPSLKAELPLAAALLDRRFLVRRLVAIGWTLDLRQARAKKAWGPAESAPAEAEGQGAPPPAKSVSAQDVARLLCGTLSRWALPCDVSLDGVDLEGDVLVAPAAGSEPVRVHVIVKGGGMAVGREGTFAIDASGDFIDAGASMVALAGHGQIAVAMKSPRTFHRLEVKADLSTKGGLVPEGLTFSADVAADLDAREETFSLELNRGSQHLATVVARVPEGASQLAGTWKLDVQDSDVALFAPNRPLPRFTATGDGRFDCDLALAQVHALGRLGGSISHLGVLAPSLERLGAVTLDADFDAIRTGQSVRVDRLDTSLAGAGAAAVVRSLQSFDINEHTGELKPLDPVGDWADVSLRGFPLAWLTDSTSGFALSGGDAAGAFVVRAATGGFALRSKAPVIAAGVSVQRADKTIGRNLDLSLSVLAEYGSAGWQIQAAPLVINSGGRRVATFDGKASQPAEPDQPVAIAGTWNADVQALASGAVVPDLSWIQGRSASGDFSAKVGGSTELDGKLSVIGRDEHHAITASLHAEVDETGRISFLAPVKIALGPTASDLSVEGTSIRDEAGTRLYVKLTGKEVVLEQLRLVAATLAEAGGATAAATAGPETPARVRDRIPFWGDWTGNIAVAFVRLKAGEMAFDDVGGAFQLGHGSIRLEGGHGGLTGQRFTNVEGSIAFDAAAEFPYSLKVTASLDRVDAAPLFPVPKSGGEPPIEGLFTIAGTVTGNGINLDDLAGRTQEEFRLTSSAGIVRVLKTDVDEAFPPEKASSVSDTLGRMGSGVGSFFGVEDTGNFGKKSVGPTAEAVIAFLNDVSEIGIDEVTLTAVRGPDRTIHLMKIAMTAGDERLTGSGQITYVNGLSLRSQPLSVDLQFWARGRVARHLAKAGLLSTDKDSLGYARLSQPIHLGGTLEHIDRSQWHNLLVKTAAQSPAGPKKTP